MLSEHRRRLHQWSGGAGGGGSCGGCVTLQRTGVSAGSGSSSAAGGSTCDGYGASGGPVVASAAVPSGSVETSTLRCEP
eukprot:2420-Heterococcus_DN1.PRE.2